MQYIVYFFWADLHNTQLYIFTFASTSPWSTDISKPRHITAGSVSIFTVILSIIWVIWRLAAAAAMSREVVENCEEYEWWEW